jgi:hypothetical protein
MNFRTMKIIYAASCMALCLIILAPTLILVVPPLKGEVFSELWILGPDHTDSLPFNISATKFYTVYVGINNHMADLEYYAVRVKLRNQSDPMPITESGLSIDLPTVFEYRVFLADNGIWEKNIAFSFSDVSFDQNVSCRISNIVIDGYDVNVNKIAAWNETSGGFYYQLSFELWVYNSTISAFQFHDRSVWLWLSMSGPL